MADIREEDFNRMQAQIIELRTANYDTEVKYQRQNNELEQLREKCAQIEKELEKSNKIVQKSKNRKEYALLLEENEGLQHRLRDHEEDFKLQNKTLLEEVTRIEDENKKLLEEIKILKAGKEGDGGSVHEAELRRLKAENAVLQKSLKSTQALLEADVQKSNDRENLPTPNVSKQTDVDGQVSDTLNADEGANAAANNENKQQLTLNDILNELTQQISLTFELFCNEFELRCKKSEGHEGGSVGNDVLDATSEDRNADEETHCTLDKLETLKEKVQSNISILLQDKVASLNLNGSQQNSEEANVIPSTQLTEIQLQLATEREEKHILEEQLATLEGNLRKEISRLEEEVNKLTEKAKKKQESFTQLQNEKENLYNDNKKMIDEMKLAHSTEMKNLTEQIKQLTQDFEAAKKELEQHQQVSESNLKELQEKLLAQENQATSNVEETIQELDNTRIENSSLCEQLQSLQEACKSYRIENEDQKAMMITMQDKMKDMEDREITLKADRDKMKSDMEESKLSYEHLRRQVDETMSEKEQYINSANDAAKLAEKRKQLLDEFSIDRQKLVAEHKEQLERLETSYKDEAAKNQSEFKKTIEDLKTQLQGEKKLKKDLEESQQQLTDVTSQLTSLESKCGWFERRLTETEENLNEEKAKAAETIEETKKEHAKNIDEKTSKHENELQDLNEKLNAIEAEKKEQLSVIEKFKQEVKDKDVENVIAGKKGDHLVKDLKRQLKLERKKTEQLQQRLQEVCSENRARENFENLFDPNLSKESGRRNSGDSSMLSGSSVTNESQDTKEPSPDSSFSVSVNDETMDLIARVADLQQEKWQLEERAMMITMQDKMKDMEDREITLKADRDKMKSDMEESKLSYEHLRRQVDETMSEKEQYINSANDAAKLAEKRKQLLDEFSIDRQKLVAEHKEQLERLETSYKDEAAKNQSEFKKTIEDLKTQLQGEKKLKKDLEESQQQLTDVTSQLTSLESKCGWFERRLTETEENLNEEKAKAAETIEETKKEHAKNIDEKTSKHENELQDLNEKLNAIEAEKKEQLSVIEKFKQEVKDKDVENVIAGKKGDHLVKDLKRQLKLERKKTEQLQQRLQEVCSENRARENFENLFDPNLSKESGRRNSGDSSMLSGSSVTNESQDTKEPSPDSSFSVSVNDETMDLIARVADLQQEKWQLEERVRHLEENCSAMAEDLMRKSAVIEHYSMEAKLDGSKEISSPQESNFKSRMKGTFNIGKQEVLLKDMNKKLQRMLEETLMKNIQMQKDMDLLTKDQDASSIQGQPSNNSDKT